MSFDDFFKANLPQVDSFHPHFNESLVWILNAGGKHFRAKLLLGVVEALSKDLNLVKNAYSVAMGVELLHTYSLIHDDLPTMDNADFRRGVQTIHKKFDETTAVLVGDALNTHAFYMLSQANLDPKNIIKCVEILSKNGGIYGMIIGQAIDCHFENKKLNLDDLIFLHTKKTGALIAASMQMGAVIAGCGEESCDQIYFTGIDLGLAFQIHDDILDATSTSEDVGKPVQNDAFKNSFTNLLGIEEAIKFRDNLEDKIISSLENTALKNLISNLINQYLRG
nr:polyprenyl synthetase family protein [Campylobacter sp.]